MFDKIISMFFNREFKGKNKVVMRDSSAKCGKVVLLKTKEEVIDNYVNEIVKMAKLNESKVRECEEKQNIYNMLLNACNCR